MHKYAYVIDPTLNSQCIMYVYHCEKCLRFSAQPQWLGDRCCIMFRVNGCNNIDFFFFLLNRLIYNKYGDSSRKRFGYRMLCSLIINKPAPLTGEHELSLIAPISPICGVCMRYVVFSLAWLVYFFLLLLFKTCSNYYRKIWRISLWSAADD